MEPHDQLDPALGLSSGSKVADLEPIPSSSDIQFPSSSFFQKHNSTSLPSPTSIREIARRSPNPRATLRTRPPPVSFPHLGVLVKYGTEVSIAEGQCLLLVRRTLSPTVPVPEVYGWCKDDGQVFIYMELIDGVTLEKSWETLIEKDRLAICQQLRCMIDAWRSLKCDDTSAFIGK